MQTLHWWDYTDYTVIGFTHNRYNVEIHIQHIFFNAGKGFQNIFQLQTNILADSLVQKFSLLNMMLQAISLPVHNHINPC